MRHQTTRARGSHGLVARKRALRGTGLRRGGCGAPTAHVGAQLGQQLNLALRGALRADSRDAGGRQRGNESGDRQGNPRPGDRGCGNNDAKDHGGERAHAGDDHAAASRGALGGEARCAAGAQPGDVSDRLIIAAIDDGPGTSSGGRVHASSARQCAPSQDRSTGAIAHI